METFNINILVNKVTVLNIKRVLYIIKQISNKYVKNKLINQRYLYILMMKIMLRWIVYKINRITVSKQLNRNKHKSRLN